MKNLAGCSALVGFALLTGAALAYWSVVVPGLDPAAAASTVRCLGLLVAGGFFGGLAIIIGAPMGKGGRRR